MAESPPLYTPAPPQTNPYHAGYDQSVDHQQKYGQRPYPSPPLQQPAVYTHVNVTQISPNSVAVGYLGRDNRCFAIFVCLCCCWPLGIVAFYYASKAQDEYRSGNTEEAERCQGRARTFIILSIVIGVPITVIGSILIKYARESSYH